MGRSTALFDQLYGEHYATVRQLCLGYLRGDAAAADDLAQETFVQVWRNLSQFRGAASAKTWIYRVAVNVCLQEIRYRDRRPTVTDLPDEARSEPAERPNERFDQLYRAIGELPEVDRLVYMLKLDGQTTAEISNITGLSTGALRVRIHRANAKLRQLFHHV